MYRLLFPVLLLASIPAAAAPPDFDRTVAPLIIKRCIECHGPTEPKGGLDLTTKKTVVGLDEESVVVPSKLAMSRLWEQIHTDEMPPKHPLSVAEKAVFKNWIESGANWGRDPIDPLALSTSERGGRDWWALQPLKPHAVPAGTHPIDHFVAISRTAKGLSASAPADPRTLVRRLYFDLIGLPPSPETIEAYANNPSDEAYFALVDKLLASPQYGERWARHWLDLVRYGESDGFERNAPRPNAWHYRDFVIAAFNADMPFDQFAKWQIAGDILQPDEPAAIKATGFLVAGIHNTVLGSNAISNATARQDEIEDILAAVGQTFLGLTVQCARCHDHKFDAITQVDYYRFAAALGGVNHGERPAKKAEPTLVYAISPKPAPPTHVLSRGNVEKPKAVVSAGGVASIPGMANFGLPHDAPEGLRRQKLAEWIARPDNPAFTRTIVNRLWHHHFGTGLVDSPSDLGFNGGRPSHPELLDWLASELVRQKFHLKPLHRLMVTSTTYRQSSTKLASAFAKDADNRLLWRMSPRRLEGEAIRDAMLVVAGKLNPKAGGPGYHDVRTYGDSGTLYYEPIDPIGDEFQRRTIYRFSPRGERSALLETFDCPDPSALTPRRQMTTTPLQALALWNDSFVLRTSQSFAERIGAEGKGVPAQIDRAYRLSLGRQPSDEERKRATAVVEKHGLAALCRVLFNCNEFVVME